MNKLNEKAIELKLNLDRGFEKSRKIINDNAGLSAFEITMAVLVGAVLIYGVMTGLTDISDNIAMPGISSKITDMFNFGS